VKDAPNEPSRQVVLQRIHNQILDYLETASSFDKQREYQRNVPRTNVAGDMLCEWSDWYDDAREPEYVAPAFSDSERAAMASFHRVWNEVADATPRPLPDLESAIRMPDWTRLREAAERALAVFRVRGPLPEDEEIDSV